MIGIVAHLQIDPAKRSEFEQIAKDLMAKVKANESACLTYQLYKSNSSQNDYIFMEQYADQAALKAHGKTEYLQAMMPDLGACLTARPDIRQYEIVE